jgi:hypothetical protein
MAIYKSDGVDGVAHTPKKFVNLNTIIPTSTTITKGELLMIDTGVTTNGMGMNVIQASGTDLHIVIGVAAETITNSSSSVTLATTIRVQVAGLNQDVTATGSNLLVGKGAGHTGTAIKIYADSVENGVTTAPWGLVVDQYTASTADGGVLIYDHGFYG